MGPAVPRIERWGVRGLLLLGPLLFFTRLTENPYSVQIAWVQSGVALLFFLKFLSFLRQNEFTVWRTPLDLPFVALTIVLTTSTFLSWLFHPPFYRPAIAAHGVRALAFTATTCVGVFWLSTQTADTRDRRIAGQIVTGAVTLAALYGVMQFGGWDPLWKHGAGFGHRPISTFGNPNFLSTALVLMLPASVHAFLTARSRGEAVSTAIAFLIQTTALLATMTRSSWMGAVAGLSLFALLHRPRGHETRNRALVLLALGAGVVGLWPVLTHGRSVSVLAHARSLWTGVTGEAIYASWHQRLLIWAASLDLWRDAPLWGKGWGAFEVFYPFAQARWLILPAFAGLRTHANNAHQLLLEFSSQSGVIGLGILLWIGAVGAAWTRAHREMFHHANGGVAAAGWAGFFGVLIDNLGGNVSLFFTGPALLAFWTLGQSVTELDRDRRVLRLTRARAWGARCLIVAAGVLIVAPGVRFAAGVVHFKGRRALEKGDTVGALLHFQRAAAMSTDVRFEFDVGNLWAQRARDAARLGLPHETLESARAAAGAFARALRANPGYDEIASNRAEQSMVLGAHDAALRDRRWALLINPAHRDAAHRVVDHPLFDRLPPRERDAVLSTVTRFHPDVPLFWRLRAIELEKAGRSDDAAKAYERVLRLDPEDAAAWSGVARCHPSGPAPSIKEARELLRLLRAAPLDDPRERRRALARVMVLRGLMPDFPLPLLIQADLLLREGQPTEAEPLYRAFLARSPGHAGAAKNWRQALRALGRTDGGATP